MSPEHLVASPEMIERAAQLMYEGFMDAASGKNLLPPTPIKRWIEMPKPLRECWIAAANRLLTRSGLETRA